MAETETRISEPAPAPRSGGTGSVPVRRRQLGLAAAAAALIAVIAFGLLGGSGSPGPATGAAALIPADALAYVNVSLDSSRPEVRRALRIAESFPGFPLASGVLQTRLAGILSGGHGADFATQIEPWLGNEASLALLNTTTATAGSLLVFDVRDPTRARGFMRAEGATPRGAYRGARLLGYPSGSELAFVSHYLVLGQDASVRAALDVSAGAAPSLAGSAIYRRAAAREPAGRVLDAYASLAGVRRLLAPQGGVIGALGALLYQPALQGVTVSLSPAPGGARVKIHSALDPSLVRLSPPASPAFTPTLEKVMPAGAILMLDVLGLDRVAPSVLNAGAVAGVAGGIGPLLSRLGAALASEGVNLREITSIFAGETAVAIVPNAGSPTLVIVARTSHPAQVRTALAQLEVPLAQLFKPPSSGSGRVPVFNDRTVAGITDHQLVLASGLELDYAVFRGLVVISTGVSGVAAVAARSQALADEPGYRFVLGPGPRRVTALVYLNFRRLLGLGVATGLTRSARFRLLAPDLEKISAVGLTSTRGPAESSAELSVRIP